MPSELEEIRNKFNQVKLPDSIDKSEVIRELNLYLDQVNSILENWNETEFQTQISPVEMANKITEQLPDTGLSMNRIHEFLSEEVIPHFNYENNKFMAFIPRDPAPPAILGDVLSTFFNQFLGSALASPLATSIEAQTILWIGEILGYTGDFFGSYTIGGSDANQLGIYTGIANTVPWDYVRKGAGGGEKTPIVYTSDQAHLCVRKSMMYLGLGTDNLHIIPTTDTFTIDIRKLEDQIKQDYQDGHLPSLIVATAGTTNTGAIDDLKQISEIATRHDMWMHVDAAYGGFVKLTDLPVANKLNDLYLADSIAIDTHKWLFTPLEGGLYLVKDKKHALNGFDATAEYLTDSRSPFDHPLLRDFSSYGTALSRKWRGLKVWFNFKAYGRKGLSNFITRNLYLAEYFRTRVLQHDRMTLLADNDLSVICFRIQGDDEINQTFLSTMMKRGNFFISQTSLRGQIVIRACIVNQTTTLEIIDDLFDEMDTVLADILS